MSDMSKGFRIDELQIVTAATGTGYSKLQRYEQALRRIERFGHSHGHGHGYTCANIAEEALKNE
jgi:hypothetical protein